MTLKEYWKKAKKALALQVETIKNIPNSDNDPSSPLNNVEYIDATRKLKQLTSLINQTINDFHRLSQSAETFSSKLTACSQAFCSETSGKIAEIKTYNSKSVSLQQTVMAIVDDIKNNEDLAFLFSKLSDINRLNKIHNKLYNNLLLKKRAEDKVSNLVQHGTPEKREVASSEFDKRSEKSSQYQDELDEGIERLATEVNSSIKSLDVFYRSSIQKLVNAAAQEFISGTVPAEALTGSDSSDDGRRRNKKQNSSDSDDDEKRTRSDSDDERGKRSDSDDDEKRTRSDSDDDEKRTRSDSDDDEKRTRSDSDDEKKTESSDEE